MNIALIFAGGSGKRMHYTAKPKQFLQLHGKEIIIHTIEVFDKHFDIDGIVIVCIEPWIEFLSELIKKFNISKVKGIIAGGKTGQESIYLGLKLIKKLYSDDTIVLINDGVRPLIDQELISDCIQMVNNKGSAITVTPAIETILYLDNDNKVEAITDRSKCFNAKAPQCFFLKDIFECHEMAINDGFNNIIDSATLMHYYGRTLFTVLGKFENIKITTPSDFYIFKALFEARENSQIFGIY
jgi:2-C-methyl-D-erythritol 4-phosphate cytidylyltransferase